MDSEILNVINSVRGRDVSSPTCSNESDSKIANRSRVTSVKEVETGDESTVDVVEGVTLDTIFSKLSIDKGRNDNGCNEAIGNDDDYTALLNKYNEVNALNNQNLLVYNDNQYKYADAIGERDEKIAQLQKMRQIDLEYNTECKQTYDIAIVKLNSLISTQNSEIESKNTHINDLTSKLKKTHNEIEETQTQLKKEMDSRTNKYYNEVAELHNTNVLITQQLNDKTNECDKLREQHTELITKMNQYTSFNNKQIQNDKPCAIQ